MSAAAAAAAPQGKHRQSFAAWAKAHKPEAFLGVAGIAVAIYAYVKQRGSSSATSTTTPATGDGTLLPGTPGGGFGDGYGFLSNPGPTSTGTPAPSSRARHQAAVRRAHETHVADVSRAHTEHVADVQRARRQRGLKVTPTPDYSASGRTASSPEDAMLEIDRLEHDEHLTGSAGAVGGGGAAPSQAGKG